MSGRKNAVFCLCARSDVHSFSWTSAFCSLACHAVLFAAFFMQPERPVRAPEQAAGEEFEVVAVAIGPVQPYREDLQEIGKSRPEEQAEPAQAETPAESDAALAQNAMNEVLTVENCDGAGSESENETQCVADSREWAGADLNPGKTDDDAAADRDVPKNCALACGAAMAGSAESEPVSALVHSNYWSMVRSRIADAVRYPEQARRLNLEGTVHLTLSLESDGRIREVVARDGSHRLLAQACVLAARQAAPFPAPPGEFSDLTGDISFRFQLLDEE